jgi:ceramide glucosyltransferase
VVIHLGGFLADILSNATFFAFLAFVTSGFDTRLGALYVGVVAYKTYLDMQLLRLLRGRPMALLHMACAPMRDLILPVIWVYSVFSRTTEWRGERFRLGRGSVLTRIQPALGHTVSHAATQVETR